MNSNLVSYTHFSPNHSGQRNHKIDRITPHCIVGQAEVETIGSIFADPGKQASCNYGIGCDGRIALIVDEKNRSWCSSSRSNDNRAVTIECASDSYDPYAMNGAVVQSLENLCIDICRRNGKKKLIWIPDKEKALAYTPAPDEMQLTVHRWFANKACPGDWLFRRLGQLAETVTEQLNPKPEPEAPAYIWRVQVGAFAHEQNARNLVRKLKAAGFDAYITKSRFENG